MARLRDLASAGHISARFRHELALEAYRAKHHPDGVSRLRGFFVFDNAASAQAAAEDWQSIRPNTLEEVGIMPGSRFSRHDAQWITYEMPVQIQGDHDAVMAHVTGEGLRVDACGDHHRCEPANG